MSKNVVFGILKDKHNSCLKMNKVLRQIHRFTRVVLLLRVMCIVSNSFPPDIESRYIGETSYHDPV